MATKLQARESSKTKKQDLNHHLMIQLNIKKSKIANNLIYSKQTPHLT